ncbi:MAG: beta-CASP ribonuclease aCPSF1 [Candidatus Asgardarchaeia archaeon]
MRMEVLDTLRDIKQQIKEMIPEKVKITKVEFEGPEVAVYSKNPNVLIEGGDLIKRIAKKIQKRIVIRSDPSVRLDKEEARRRILEIVPKEAEITNITFDDTLGEALIEAKKPGLVIGKNGVTLRELTKAILWRPNVIRTPPIKTEIVIYIRDLLQKQSDKRRKIFLNVGMRIHRPVIFKSNWIRITALGGFREVGRTAIWVQTKESSVLIDCGVNVGSPENAFPNLNLDGFEIDSLDAVIVTHAHLDHSGLVPFLFKYGYEGPVYTTRPTRNLMALLQRDYLEVAEKNGNLLPYTVKDIKSEILHTIPLEYGEVTDITPDIRLTLHNAGHILGSSIVHLHIGDGMYNVAYTGDFKFAKTKLLEPANNKFPRLETLIMESTYGAMSDVAPSRREAEERLISILNRVIERNGIALIPVLAVGRAQEIMLVLEEYMRNKILKEVPIYVDGMIKEATAIHTAHPEYLSSNLRDQIFHKGYNPFTSEFFTSVDSREAREDITESGPSIIMATSGMLTGGPSVEYFKYLAPDPKNAIIFVSYQVEGTLGRRIQKGVKEIEFQNNSRVEAIQVNMDVYTVEGFSGHSDRRQLLRYVRKVSPRPERIITMHGEAQKCVSLANSIKKLFKNVSVMVPSNLDSIRLY